MPTTAVRKITRPKTTRPVLVDRVEEAEAGISKKKAGQLFQMVARGAAVPAGRLRAEIIPDSSWKRAGLTLSPTATQSALRVQHVLELATSIWGNSDDAAQWLNTPHPELGAVTPYSFLRTEAGGRAVESLLVALDHGFPV